MRLFKKNVFFVFILFTAAALRGQGTEQLKIGLLDTRLSGAYLICNIFDENRAPTVAGKENNLFPVLQIGDFSVYIPAAAINEARPDSCLRLLSVYRPQDYSRHSFLPQNIDLFFKNRFYGARRMAPLCLYVNYPEWNSAGSGQSVISVNFSADSTIFNVLPGSSETHDILFLDFDVKSRAHMSTAQILLLEYLFYDFLANRLTGGTLNIESPLPFLSSPSFPVHLPEFMLLGNRSAMEKLLKNWNRLENTFLRSLTMNYLETAQRKLNQQLFLYASEPLPRLTLMIKLLSKYGYAQSLRVLHRQIASENMTVFLKTVADIVRHSAYRGFWITHDMNVKGIIPAEYALKINKLNK